MKDVVRKEVIKLLDLGIIYPFFYIEWVNLVHVVPKKGGMIVVTNEKLLGGAYVLTIED